MEPLKKDEVLLKDRDKWLYFKDPHEVITVTILQDVPAALARVEEQANTHGWHAAGFLSYEAAPAFDPAVPTQPETGFPYLWFGLYPRPGTVNLPPPDNPIPSLDWRPTEDRHTYNAAIETIRDYIANGRTYQVNYTMRLQSDFDASPWEFYLHLVASQNKYAAYVDTGRYVICSASPEMFFELDGNRINCRPMKGTVHRGRTTREDQVQSEWLENSEKNRAENVMIVDMIRNDLGRIAKIGSVQVPELFQVECYPTLWQMTSTVTALTNSSLAGIFRALFPCASITGAPKISTMKMINELESSPRKIYTGTIGHIAPGRKASFNVAIRTVLIDRDSRRAEYGTGGGIVWDSTSTDEYEEALLKARFLMKSPPEFSLLETMRWTPGEGIYLREKHIERLLDSAEYFDFAVSPESVRETLNRFAPVSAQLMKLRLLLDREGRMEIQSEPLTSGKEIIDARLARTPIDSQDVFLFHKTTHRDVYDAARESHPACDDVLLYNERGELTEFTIGNLVVELDGKLVTPPVDCGLLPGTFRAHLLETGQVTERIVPVQRLVDCIKIYRVNSVRTWQTVRILQKYL